MSMDTDLKRVLRPTSPPAGFSSRVLERIHADEARSRSRRIDGGWRAVAAGLVLVSTLGGWMAQKEIERRRGERAREEVLLALRIASAKVKTAQEQVRDIGSR